MQKNKWIYGIPSEKFEEGNANMRTSQRQPAISLKHNAHMSNLSLFLMKFHIQTYDLQASFHKKQIAKTL